VNKVAKLQERKKIANPTKDAKPLYKHVENLPVSLCSCLFMRSPVFAILQPIQSHLIAKRQRETMVGNQSSCLHFQHLILLGERFED
jgi:hypothetical protein